MKTIAIIIFAAFGMLARAEDKLFDDALAKNAVAVLRISESTKVEKFDQIQCYVVSLTKEFKNETGRRLNYSLTVGVLQGHGEIPNTECTIYLVKKSPTSDFWMLVGGDATNGVSHVVIGK